EVTYCYLGDGRNNTANSLLVTGCLLGMDVRICAPAALQPALGVQAIATGLAASSGARMTITADLAEAVAGAECLDTAAGGSWGGRWASRPASGMSGSTGCCPTR